MYASYVKHDHQSDITRCPECGHMFTDCPRTKQKRTGSYSCPRFFSSVLRRKLCVVRTKYAPKVKNEPVLCDLCKRRITKCVEDFSVRPVFTAERETPQRQVITSSYKNLIRDHYAARFKHQFYEIVTSNELLTDTESENFVRSTEYSTTKIEDDLKQKLLKEYLKPSHVRHCDTNPPRSRGSSHKLRMLFLNDAADFNELQRGSSDSGPFSLECNGHTASSTQTIVTQSCCVVSENRSPHAPPKTDKNRVSESPNPNMLVKSSTFKKSNSKLKQQISNAHQSNMETQYSVISRKKKKKWRTRSVVKQERVLENMTYERDMQVQTVMPKTHKRSHVNYTRATWANKQNKLKETGISTETERLQTILETPPKTRQQPIIGNKVMGHQVKCINPSCFFVNGCLLITRENTGTQYDNKSDPEATATEVPSKIQAKAICDKVCQYYSEHKMNLAPQYPVNNPAAHQPIIIQCQCQKQPQMVKQSVCNHNPPCELVPSCFRVKYNPDIVFGCM